MWLGFIAQFKTQFGADRGEVRPNLQMQKTGENVGRRTLRACDHPLSFAKSSGQSLDFSR